VTSTVKRRAMAASVVATVGAVGLLMAHHPMLLSGLQRVQVELGDTRFNNYVLEHGYRWWIAAPQHGDFWNPPFFYPVRNVAAYSDLLISVAPVYAAFRALGLPADTSYQFWLIAMSALNYLVASHFLARRLGLGGVPTAAGAFLFAFGAPRINQLGHPQLLPQFFSLVTIDALFGLFAMGPLAPAPSAKRAVLWLAAVLGVVAQLYAGFYLGWFLILALGLAAIVGLASGGTRDRFLAVLRRDVFLIAMATGVGAFLLWPLVAHYLAAARAVAPRYSPTVRQFLPDWTAFFSLGPDSWLWGWWAGPDEAPWHEREGEKRLGIGLLTTLACGLGLYAKRDHPAVGLLIWTGLVLELCVITVSPTLVQGVCLTVILAVLADALGRKGSALALQVLAPGLLLAYLKVNAFASDALIGAGLFSLFLLVADAYRTRGDWRRCLTLTALGIGLTLWLFAPVALAYGAALGALAGCAAAVAGVRPWARAGLIGLAVLLGFAALTGYGYRPAVLRVAALALLFHALARDAPALLPARKSVGMLVLALFASLVYQRDDTAWTFVTAHVPGAAALYAVSRMGMMLLVVWSIGLGLFLEMLATRGRTVLALGALLVCLLEQGVTTPAFDKQEHRRAVSELAARVDRSDAAFFYSPHHALLPPWKYHIDAMWASLESGVPTINGYSGNKPRGWEPLSDPSIEQECDYLCLAVLLGRWMAAQGLERGRVGWVGGPDDWRLEGSPR
jgi:hypothetical protein